MIFFALTAFLLQFLCIPCYGVANSIDSTNMQAPVPRKTLFSAIRHISVTPVICDGMLDKKLIMRALEKQIVQWGKIEPDDPKNFGNQMSVLQIMIGPIAETTSEKKSQATYLPVVSISMQLLTKATLCANQEYGIFGLAWEKTNYVNQNSKNLNEQVVNNISWMLSELQQKFTETATSPIFSITLF